MAEEGIRVLARGLPRLVARPDDLPTRGPALQLGAYLAGAAFAAAGIGIHHKICHVLGGAYDLPHAEMHTVDPAARRWPSTRRPCRTRWRTWRRGAR